MLAVVAVAAPDSDGTQTHRLTERRRRALECSATALINPGHVVSGNAAAMLHGLPVYRDARTPQLTAAPPITPGNRAGMLVRPAGLAADEIGSWFGTPVTTVARTVVDLARHSRRDGLVAADAALAAEVTSTSQLDAALARARGWPGIRRARRALEIATSKAESPLESLTRLTIHDAGLPLPEPQVEVFDPALGRTYRVDGLWRRRDGRPVALEVDGRSKYSNENALWAEKRRQERLERLGYVVIRVLWSDIEYDWDDTYARILAALGHLPSAPPSGDHVSPQRPGGRRGKARAGVRPAGGDRPVGPAESRRPRRAHRHRRHGTMGTTAAAAGASCRP